MVSDGISNTIIPTYLCRTVNLGSVISEVIEGLLPAYRLQLRRQRELLYKPKTPQPFLSAAWCDSLLTMLFHRAMAISA